MVQPGAVSAGGVDAGALAALHRAGHTGLVAVNGTQQAVHLGFVVGAQVVAGAVPGAQDHHLGLVAGGHAWVVLHHAVGASARGTPAAFGADADAQRVHRLGLAGEQALALVFGFVGVGAGHVKDAQARQHLGRAGVAQLAGLLHFAQGHTAVIGAGQGELSGLQLRTIADAPQRVGVERRPALGKAHLRLAVGGKGPVVVGNDQCVAAGIHAAARRTGAFPEAEQAFFAQQALHKGQVAFLVLDAQAALRVDGGVEQVPAPLRAQRALAGVVGKHRFDDLHHAHAVEDKAVLPVLQKRQPGLHHQAVARQPAVAAQQRGLCDMAVPGFKHAHTRAALQLQQHRLAHQRLERQVRVAREHGHLQPLASGVGGQRFAQGQGTNGVVDADPLHHQRIRPQRGVQANQAGVLAGQGGAQRCDVLGDG